MGAATAAVRAPGGGEAPAGVGARRLDEARQLRRVDVLAHGEREAARRDVGRMRLVRLEDAQRGVGVGRVAPALQLEALPPDVRAPRAPGVTVALVLVRARQPPVLDAGLLQRRADSMNKSNAFKTLPASQKTSASLSGPLVCRASIGV